MGILEILTIIFVVLKLVGVITWSWWLVFLPMIICVGIYAIAFILHGVAFFKLKRDIDETFDDDFFN